MVFSRAGCYRVALCSAAVSAVIGNTTPISSSEDAVQTKLVWTLQRLSEFHHSTSAIHDKTVNDQLTVSRDFFL